MASQNGKFKDTNEWSIEQKPVKVEKWDGTAVKNALDDAVKKVFTEKLMYEECHRQTDIRLLICTIAVGFALYALVWDYLHPFPESRPVLIVCVVSYFIMTGVLTLYTTFKERGCFLLVLEKDQAGVDPDNKWALSSQLKRYDDKYQLEVVFTDGSTNKSRQKEFTKSVENFFDENGVLCFELFEPLVTALHDDLTKLKKDK